MRFLLRRLDRTPARSRTARKTCTAGAARHTIVTNQLDESLRGALVMSYAYEYPVAAQARPSERAMFIQRTYLHLAGAILAFIGIEAIIFTLLGSNPAD